MNKTDLMNEVKLSSGTIIKAENLASTLQVCLDSGAKSIITADISGRFWNSTD